MADDGTILVDEQGNVVEFSSTDLPMPSVQGATADDVERIVADAVIQITEASSADSQAVRDGLSSVRDATSADADALVQRLDAMSESLRSMSEASEDDSGSDAVYSVVLSPDQWDYLVGCSRVICTEMLICMIVCAVLCGLVVFTVLTRVWRS